jgi:hypothetical protein
MLIAAQAERAHPGSYTAHSCAFCAGLISCACCRTNQARKLCKKDAPHLERDVEGLIVGRQASDLFQILRFKGFH